MDTETYELLRTPELVRAVEEALGRDPLEVALDKRVPHAALVATQVKYLGRAAAKLPSYRAARCILPPRAFEQASSEACAAHKRIGGEAVLDLTCGLGVDAFALSRRFGRVVTLERDPLLARIARDNFARLGVTNVEVVCAAAEEYLARTGGRFDWVYADPDRRDAAGRKQVRLEACSPDIVALMPAVRRVAGRLCLKNSPLFDVDAAFALFGGCETEVVSLGGECKEVMVYADGREPRITATALGLGSFGLPRCEAVNAPCTEPFEPGRYGWLVVPDVALQKARLTLSHLRGKADAWSNNSFAFARERPEGVLGRVLPIERVEPYDPKALRRELRGEGVDMLCREFPFSVDEVRRRTGMRSGDAHRLALTRIAGRCWTVRIATRR